MKYGFFDDQKREYVITTPETPLPWINYLGSEDFFALCSNTAGGYSFYRDARLCRITRYRYNNCPIDQEGFHFYIKDGENVWNPGWQPTKTKLDRYSCRHGLGYTVIEGEKDGVTAVQEMFVPKGDNCLLIRVTLKTAPTAKRASTCFLSSNGASGTQTTTRRTSSAIFPSARSRSAKTQSTTKPNTAKDATTMRFGGAAATLTALTRAATHSAEFTAVPLCRRLLQTESAQTPLPTAGSPLPPSSFILSSAQARAQVRFSVWATLKIPRKNGNAPTS